MNHQDIKNEFIIERFIEGELEQSERREFFEHCIQCPDCCRKVYIAGKIDDAIFRATLGRKKPVARAAKKLNKTLIFSTFAAVAIIAVIIVTVINTGDQNNTPQVVENPKIQTEKPKTPVIDKKDTIKPDTRKKEEQSQPKEQIKKEPEPERTPASYDEKPTEYLAYAEVNYDLDDLGDLAKIVTDGGTSSIVSDKPITKGGDKPDTIGSNNSKTSKEIILKEFEDASKSGSSNPDILAPAIYEKLSYGKPFEGSWTSENQRALFTVSFVKNGEVTRSFKDIQETKIRLEKGLPVGEYFMVVIEQGSTNWHVVKFSVK